MQYKFYTMLLASEDDPKNTQEYVRVSLKNSEVFAPVLTFEGDKENIKEQINETVVNLLNSLP